MVDFQERDTRRSLGSDEAEAEEGGDESVSGSDDADETGENDRSADSGTDQNADAGGDPDSGAERSADSGAERSADSGAERSADSGTDRSADSGTDRSADSGTDRSADSGTDRSADSGTDRSAGHEGVVATDQQAGHDHHAGDLESVSAAVLTISSSRSIDEDDSGDAIVEVLEAAGHSIATRDVVNDDYDGVQSAVDRFVGRKDVDAVVTTGGTGVAPEDVTPEAIRPLFEKELPGFGETFRALSRDEIGTRAIATRAVAGIADGVPVFCLPGSEDAVRLGTTEIVEPEVRHLAGLSRPHDAEE